MIPTENRQAMLKEQLVEVKKEKEDLQSMLWYLARRFETEGEPDWALIKQAEHAVGLEKEVKNHD